jgi:hypothetical protein
MDIVVAQKSLDQRKDRQARYDLSCTQDRKATSIHLQPAYLVMSLNHRYLTTLHQSLDTTDLVLALHPAHQTCKILLRPCTYKVYAYACSLHHFGPLGGGSSAEFLLAAARTAVAIWQLSDDPGLAAWEVAGSVSSLVRLQVNNVELDPSREQITAVNVHQLDITRRKRC